MPAALILAIFILIATPARADMLAITGGTVIDGTGNATLSGGTILIRDSRVVEVGPGEKVNVPREAERIDARGKYVIPGLMDANVHLGLSHNINLEVVIRYEDRFDEIVLEAAQLALKGGVTTVFDTWGPLEPIKKVREAINAGETTGSRIFVGGNIIGVDGLFKGFFPASAAENVTQPTRDWIDNTWKQGVGAELQTLSPDELRSAIREYIDKDVDFIKYLANEGSTLFFPPDIQKAIVEVGHQAGLSVQAHITTAEALLIAVEAGLDIATHGDMTIPPEVFSDETIQKLVDAKVAVSLLPFTERRLEAMEKYRVEPFDWVPIYRAAVMNRRNMISAGVTILLSTDAYIKNPVMLPEKLVSPEADRVDSDREIGEAHFNALVALEEDGMVPMEILKAATSNIARAYRVDADLGTIEAGKIADVLVLDSNPLESAHNYRSISTLIQAGRVIDRNALPVVRLLSTENSD